MGVLIDFVSEDLRLPRRSFATALGALRKLAKTDPDVFDDPDAVENAADLEEAIASASFRCEKNADGDIVELRYGVDKAPSDADESWPEPICRALASALTAGTIKMHYDGERFVTVYRFTRGKLSVRRVPYKPVKAKKQKAPPSAAFAGEPLTYTPLPASSRRIIWSIVVSFEELRWYRDRALVSRVIEALAATALWRTFDSVTELDRPPLLVVKPGATLDAKKVIALVANGVSITRAFSRHDGEVSIELGISQGELEVILHARDGALASDDVIRLVHALREIGGDSAWIAGHGRLLTARSRDETTHTSLPVRWPADAFALILDPRIPDHEEAHAETLRLSKAKPPTGCKVTRDGDVHVLKDGSYDRWLGRHVERFEWKTPRGKPPAPRKTATKTPGDVGAYELWWRIELEFTDRTMWYREPARVRRVVEALAETAWWSEVKTSVDKVVAAAINVRGLEHVEGPDAQLTIGREGTTRLVVRMVARPPAMQRLGARAITDGVALVRTLRDTFRGRASLVYAAARPYGGAWAQAYSEKDEPKSDFEWPECACVALVFDPGADVPPAETAKMARNRALAMAPASATARREEHDGLVSITFIEDVTNPLQAAAASQEHARWQRWVRGD